MIADNLKKYREELGLSMNGLSRLAKVSTSYIHDIEHGIKLNPSQDVIARLADALGLTKNELIYGKDSEEALNESDVDVYLSKIRDLPSKSQERIISIIEAFLEESED